MLHYFPLEHIPNRYTTHLDRDILKYLDKKGIQYIYYEPKTPAEKDAAVSNGCFLNAVDTIYRQMYQMTKFLENYAAGKVKDGDILFFSDLWNFQVPAFRYLEFFMKKHLKVRGILWAGAFTDADLVHNMERTYHGFEETILDICDKIYVGTQDFKDDIIRKRYVNPDKIVVSKAPLDFEGLDRFKGTTKEENLIVFNGRHSPEKHPELFNMLQKYRPQYKYIDTVGAGLNRDEYYAAMARAKVVISFADEETFGFGMQEGTYLDAVPVVPNKVCYPEEYGSAHCFNDFFEAVELVDAAIAGKLKPMRTFVTDNDEVFDIWFKECK